MVRGRERKELRKRLAEREPHSAAVREYAEKLVRALETGRDIDADSALGMLKLHTNAALGVWDDTEDEYE